MKSLKKSPCSSAPSWVNWIARLLALAVVLGPVPSPGNPVLVGQWPGYARGNANGVFVTNNLAFIAADAGGLIIMDVSNPAHPVRVGGCDTSGSAGGVAVSGNYAYVTD
jgi:hypothetical protein